MIKKLLLLLLLVGCSSGQDKIPNGRYANQNGEKIWTIHGNTLVVTDASSGRSSDYTFEYIGDDMYRRQTDDRALPTKPWHGAYKVADSDAFEVWEPVILDDEEKAREKLAGDRSKLPHWIFRRVEELR